MIRETHLRSLFVALSLTLTAQLGAGATIFGGVEDTQGNTGIEHNGDYNDLMFKITGNISFNSPAGLFGNLTPAVINEAGTVFWDQRSGDGPNQNVGFYMPTFGANQYLATASGGSVNDVTFLDAGMLTITILGGITGNQPSNTLGWYDPSNPTVLHQLFLGAGPGATTTFTPTSTFALYSTNGLGPFFSSESSANTGESTSQEHFAFFQQTSSVPEPSSILLTGIGMGVLAFGSARLRRKGI